MKKTVTAGLICAVLLGSGVSAADPTVIGDVDLGSTRYYGGVESTVTHEQVMNGLQDLNRILEKDYGWGKAGMATGYKQFAEKLPTLIEAVQDIPGYGDQLVLGLIAVNDKALDTLGGQFGVKKEEADAVYKEVIAADKEKRPVDTSKFSDNQKKLYDASRTAYLARQAETNLINALPKVVDKTNEMVGQINANTAAIEGKADQAVITEELGKKVDKAAQAAVDTAQNARMDGLKTSIERTGALTGALAGLHPAIYDPMAPTQVMGSVATYKGEFGYALGVAHYLNENFMLNGGIAYDGHDEFMGNVGFTVKVGQGGSNVPSRYQAGPISSIYVLQQENEETKARLSEVDELRARVAELEAKLDALTHR